MKLFVGIKQLNHFITIAALDNHGVAVVKNQFPITASYEAIIDSLNALKHAFQAPLKIAICPDDYLNPTLIDAVQKHHGHVKLVKNSSLYSTDLFPEDTLESNLYRNAITLAILTSLSD